MKAKYLGAQQFVNKTSIYYRQSMMLVAIQG